MSGCIRTTVHHGAIASTTLSHSSGQLQTVATLRVDDQVDAVFACTRKERQLSRAGSPYLTVELRDSTGAILARAFRDADVLDGRFQRGELVRVSGRVQRFRDQLQIELRSIARAEDAPADTAQFLPTAYRDRDELEGFLEHLAREVYDPSLKALLETLLSDEQLRAEIRRAPCSLPGPPPGAVSGVASGGSRSARAPSGHHAYLGGLLEHTVAVATIALELCTLHPRLNRDLLLAAAIVHDLGKTREFTYRAEIERSREGILLGHIQLGLRLIAEHMPASLDGERRLALEHCVLMHHGPESASGQRFASPEALALYRLNALDAQVKGVLEHGGLASGA
jgi:3'-5' exoribonuclease